MQFVKNVVNVPKNTFLMSSFKYNKPNPVVNRSIEISTIINNPINEASKKSKWGEPTWYLFHTLAHKLKDEYVETLLPELFQMIVLLCSNLPCPTCTKHATEYMSKINAKNVKTREDLKNLLFQFHNDVNKRKMYPIFERSKLDEKYESANTIKIIYYFFHFFNQKEFNISMITNNLYREKASKTMQSWLMKNIGAFHQ